MGYTFGRRHTEESLRKIAKQYNTRSEFQRKDSSAYSSARKIGHIFLNSICEHMICSSYSTPQLICKKILETLLDIKCLYNTKTIITPYEIDIYFSEFKLGIEYNGKGWHDTVDAIRRDNNKKMLCYDKNITLIIIKENNRNYEQDVKKQLIENLEIINKSTNNFFTNYDIEKINCFDIYDEILKTKDIGEIKKKISDCSSIKEFKKRYISEYNFLIRNKKLELLKHLKTIKTYTDKELIEECKKITNYSDLLKNYYNIYQSCYKRGLLEKATEHMYKIRRPYRNYKDQELIDLGNKYKSKSNLKNKNTSLHLELIKRNILKSLKYTQDNIYKSRKEEVLEKCLEESKKYRNFNDFKKNVDLYKLCIKYKIVEKVRITFPKDDINEIILIESKKYKNFEEFTKSIWYKKTKKITGLIQIIKKQNNWSFKKIGKMNYIERYPDIVKMINDNIELHIIHKKTLINKTTLWRLKKQMHEFGILKVEYNPKEMDK
jgi:hypothetical protein